MTRIKIDQVEASGLQSHNRIGNIHQEHAAYQKYTKT